MMRLGILVERCHAAQVVYCCNGKANTLPIDNIWNFATFNLYTLHSKKPISPKVFNRFSKSLRQLEDVEGGHLGGKCQLRRYFSFAMARLKLCASTTFEDFATFNLYSVPAKILYLAKVFNRFSKSLAQLEDVEGGHFGGKFHVRR